MNILIDQLWLFILEELLLKLSEQIGLVATNKFSLALWHTLANISIQTYG